jgi:hypothetical protein
MPASGALGFHEVAGPAKIPPSRWPRREATVCRLVPGVQINRMCGTGQRSSRRGASGKLTAGEARALIANARRLIDAVDPSTFAGLRDRAVLGLICCGAPVDAVIRLKVEDCYRVGQWRWLRVATNGKERHSMIFPAL